MNLQKLRWMPTVLAAVGMLSLTWPVLAQESKGKKPNILFIMGDDIGIMNVGAYHQGLMVGETPNIDRLAAEGGRFMDYYAMQSCTSGHCASSPACIRSVSASPSPSCRVARPGCVMARRQSPRSS